MQINPQRPLEVLKTTYSNIKNKINQRINKSEIKKAKMSSDEFLGKASGAFKPSEQTAVKKKEISKSISNDTNKSFTSFKKIFSTANKVELPAANKIGTKITRGKIIKTSVQVFEVITTDKKDYIHRHKDGTAEYFSHKPIIIKKEQSILFIKFKSTKKMYNPEGVKGVGGMGHAVEYKPVNATGKSYVMKESKEATDTSILDGHVVRNQISPHRHTDGLVESNVQVFKVNGKMGNLQASYEGDLFNKIEKSSALTTKEKVAGLKQLSRGLAKMHKKNFFHGDIKANNVFTRVKPETKGNAFIRLITGGLFQNCQATC